MAPRDGQPVVLVVEDVGLVRMNLSATLEGSGFRVVEASSVDTAIAMLEGAQGSIDIVLTDLNLSGPKTGADLLRWVAAHQPRVVRAVCTAQAVLAPTDDASAPSLVFDKPFDPLVLSRDLWAALSR
jgi:CheY-like chemotaxis protein